jgi:hypothetical protein
VLLLLVILIPGVSKFFPTALKPATVAGRLLVGVDGGLLAATGLKKLIIN